MNHKSLSLTEQRELAQSDPAHASDLAAACHRQIERLNPTLNAFITVIPSEATMSSSDIRNGLLYGIPIAVKDLYDR